MLVHMLTDVFFFYSIILGQMILQSEKISLKDKVLHKVINLRFYLSSIDLPFQA